MSDQFSTLSILNFKLYIKEKSVIKTFYDYQSCNIEEFQTTLKSSEWRDIYQSSQPETLMHKFKDICESS